MKISYAIEKPRREVVGQRGERFFVARKQGNRRTRLGKTLSTDPVSVEAATGWLIRMTIKDNGWLSTDPVSVGAATFELNLLVNHPIDSFNSCPVAASTDAGSVESLDKVVLIAGSCSVAASTDTGSVEI